MVNASVYSPFMVSIFCEQGKPKDIEEFDRPSVSEVEELEKDGNKLGSQRLLVDLTAVRCDVRASSFVMCHA